MQMCDTSERNPGRWLRAARFGFVSMVALLPAGGRTSDFLDVVLRNESERRADYDALAASWLDAMADSADDPRLELLVRRLRSIVPHLRDPEAFGLRVEALRATGRIKGISAQVLADLLASHLRRQGRAAEERKLQEGRGFLTSFLVVGPFGKGKPGPLRRAFAPEESAAGAPFRDGWQTMDWRRVTVGRPDPVMRPYDHVYPSRGIVYVLAQLRSDAPRDVVVHVGSTDALRLWVNGHELDEGSAEDRFFPTRRAVGCHLEEGWNHVLLKTNDSFWIRVADAEGDPLPPGTIVEEREGVLRPRPAEASPAWAGPFRRAAYFDWPRSDTAPGAAEDGDDATGDPDLAAALDHAALGMLYAFYGRSDLAVREVENALQTAGEDPFVLHHSAGVLSSANHLPPTMAKNRARAAWEKVASIDPEFVPAEVRLSVFLHEDGKSGEAANQLRALAERHPRALTPLFELRRIFSQKDWEADERLVLEKLDALAPLHPLRPLREAAWAQDRGNPSLAIERYREALRRDRRQLQLLRMIASAETRCGNHEGAIRALRSYMEAEPDDLRAGEELAEVLLAAGKGAEAVEILERRVSLRPWDPECQKAHAQALERTGREAEALAGWRQALKLAPGDLDLLRFVGPRLDRDRDFWSPHDERLEDWIDRVPSGGSFLDGASAVSVLDLAVVAVEPDGSHREYIHQAFKLLSDEAKKSLARAQTPGEIHLLRTITPDGGVLEPVAAEGKQSFVMPGLEPGAVIEYAYLSRDAEAGGRPFSSGPFFFQDFGFQMAFLLSRYVLILPPAIDSELMETALEESARRPGLAHVKRTETTLEHGTRVIVYEARSVPRLEDERSMPDRTEYLPNVRVVPRWSWDDVAEFLRDQRIGTTLMAPEIERAAAEVVADVSEPLARARALYAFVNELVASSRQSGDAVRVLLEKSGDRTLLFKALADAAGLRSSWAYLRPNDELLPRVDWDLPRPELFGAPHVLLEDTAEEPLWISLADRGTPFGVLSESYAGGRALVLAERTSRVVSLPDRAPESYASRMTGRVELRDDLGAEVDISQVTRAYAGYAQKEQFRTLPAFQKNLLLRAYANQLFPGAQVRSAELENLDSAEDPVTISVDLVAPRLVQETGAELRFRSVLQPFRLVRMYGGPASRQHPAHLRTLRAVRDHLEIAVAPAYRIVALPRDVATTSRVGEYSLTHTRKDGTVVVRRELTLRPCRLEPAEFASFLEFCEAVDAAERESMVLARP